VCVFQDIGNGVVNSNAESIKMNGSEKVKSVLCRVCMNTVVINLMKCYIKCIFPVKRVPHAEQVIFIYY